MIDRYSPPDMAAIWTEEAKMQRWLEIEIAAVEARSTFGEVPKKDLDAIKTNARFSVDRALEIEKTTKHDVIAFLTSVSESLGAESRHIHQGMTSSDVLDTALSMQLRDAALLLLKDTDALLKVMSKMAKKHKYTLQIGRTHGIHAEPITFGLKLLLWREEMIRNRERLRRAKDIISVGKLSGAVGTFEHLSPKVEAYVCKKLGLKPAPIATQVVQRDRHAEYLCALAVVAASIEKFSVELRHLQRTEVRETEEYFAKGQKGSSAMPHKRNPITFERLTGLARLVRSNAHAGLENVALWHERDISHSSVERVIMPDSTIIVCYLLRSFREALDTLVVYPERMKENLSSSYGLLFSQTLLLALTTKGLTREAAYALVQRNAMRSWNEKIHLETLVLADDEIKMVLTEKDIRAVFSADSLMKKMKKNVDALFARCRLG